MDVTFKLGGGKSYLTNIDFCQHTDSKSGWKLSFNLLGLSENEYYQIENSISKVDKINAVIANINPIESRNDLGAL